MLEYKQRWVRINDSLLIPLDGGELSRVHFGLLWEECAYTPCKSSNLVKSVGEAGSSSMHSPFTSVIEGHKKVRLVLS